jgi:hypothetical protein
MMRRAVVIDARNASQSGARLPPVHLLVGVDFVQEGGVAHVPPDRGHRGPACAAGDAEEIIHPRVPLGGERRRGEQGQREDQGNAAHAQTVSRGRGVPVV